MQKVIFTQGLPGSGKSTWAKQYCIDNPSYVRVCRDDLRHMRGKYWIPEQEEMISIFEAECLRAALMCKKNVIVDATNFNPNFVMRLREIALEATRNACDCEYKVFDTSLEECIMRDAGRGASKVGEQVIRDFYVKWLYKDMVPAKQDETLPKAIICDLDGTLAHSDNKRGWYDYDKVGQDRVDDTVLEIINKYLAGPAGDGPFNSVIFMSGREDSCKEITEKWLTEKCGIRFPIVILKKTGDNRSDEIAKKELYEVHIKDKYYVEFILEDRDKVVKMWRSLGLKCLQVADGNF